MNPHPAIRVAVIEDTKDLCQTLQMMINASFGLSCEKIFYDGKSAVESLSQDPPDVVLTDLGLPDISGIECIRAIKAVSDRTQFLVFTIKDQDEEVFNALQAGASGYLLKNASPGEIIQAIRDLHEGGAPMSAAIARKVVGYFRTKQEVNREIEQLLTCREKEVLDLLSTGKYYKEIADHLFISVETVKSHCHNIYEKLHVSTRTEAVNKYYRR